MRFFNSIALSLTTAIAVVKSAMIYSCTEPNTIALTFDDGPGSFTEELLDELRGSDIHVTFFINGNNWLGDLTNNPSQAIIGKAAADGHQIASHTWAHKVPLTNPERQADMDRVSNLIEANAGYRPTYFRAPLGECDEACVSFFESIGYKVIQWDTDTNDWNYAKFMQNPEGEDEQDIAQARVKTVQHVKNFLTENWGQRKSNYLVLMHDVQVHTVKEVVPWLLKHKPEGYKFVTVAECLGDPTLGKANGAAGAAAGAVGTGAVAGSNVVGAPNGAVAGTQTVGSVAQSATVAPTVAPTVQSNIVSGNNTESNLQKSGAVSVTSNLYIATALLVYSLYLLL